MIDLTFRFDGLDEAIEQLDPKVVQLAHNRTITELTRKARTRAKKSITADYNVKAGEVLKRMGKPRFSGFGLQRTGMIMASGRRMSIAKFGARQLKKGVSYRVKRSGGRKTIKHAWLAKMPSGHVGVFTHGRADSTQYKGGSIRRKKPLGRRGKNFSQLPIDDTFGPSIPQMMGWKHREVERMVADEYDTILTRNLDHYFKKSAGVR